MFGCRSSFQVNPDSGPWKTGFEWRTQSFNRRSEQTWASSSEPGSSWRISSLGRVTGGNDEKFCRMWSFVICESDSSSSCYVCCPFFDSHVCSCLSNWSIRCKKLVRYSLGKRNRSLSLEQVVRALYVSRLGVNSPLSSLFGVYESRFMAVWKTSTGEADCFNERPDKQYSFFISCSYTFSSHF